MLTTTDCTTRTSSGKWCDALASLGAALLDKIATRQAVVGVIGLGYVGLPLAVGFAQAGFRVVGIDVDAKKVASLNAGLSYIEDVPSDQVAALRAQRVHAPRVMLESWQVGVPVMEPVSGHGNGNGHGMATAMAMGMATAMVTAPRHRRRLPVRHDGL